MSHSTVEIQTSPDSVPTLPEWFGEVSLVVQYLKHQGLLDAITERVRFARGRMGTYDVIDFVAVLIGYAISGERTLQAFYERLQPFAVPFMALFGREQVPHRSSLARFLADLEQDPVEALRTLFEEDLVARGLAGEHQRGLWDRCGQQWHFFDIDGTRAAARQRALPQSSDLPPSRRRLQQVCALGYRGHKRGEVVRTRTVVQEASTHRFFGTFSGAGNGDYRGELSRALLAVRTCLTRQSVDLRRVIARLDGLYGDGVVVGDVERMGLGWLTRGRDYAFLDQPPVQAFLALPAQQQHTQADSGLRRQLFDCPQVLLTARGTRSRVIIARHTSPTSPPPVGVLRAGQVYELFYTSLPPDAFLPADVLDLYFQRGGFESSLADEDQEQDADRWCSRTPWGQECWQILAQWVWNLRIELAHLAQPTALRTTLMAEAVVPEPGAEPSIGPALPDWPVVEASAPQQWAKAARSGLFAGQDFTPEEDGTLRCPAGQTLRERERRPQADGSLRIYYAAQLSSCRACALRSQCLRREATQTLGRKVSVVVGRTPAPTRPAPAPHHAPLPVGTEPVLWRDWGRRAGRRAWMRAQRRQQVTLHLLPIPPPPPSRLSPVLSRAQRAHRRLAWAERLSRNASPTPSPRVRLHLCGIPVALAQALGVAS
jgi:hypothetical protein